MVEFDNIEDYSEQDIAELKRLMDRDVDTTHIQRVLQTFMDEGLIVDHRQENYD